MRKGLALLWLLVAVAATLHVVVKSWHGLPMQTDLMALLPSEERDGAVHAAKTRMAREVSQRVVILVGHTDRAQARQAAQNLRDGLVAAGVLEAAGDVPAPEALRRLGQTYFPHRAGLLAEADRLRLADGHADDVVQRAMAQIYGVGGMADARLLAADPFLLFPAFLTDLPVPASRLSMDDGWPVVSDGGTNWVLISGKLTGEAYALETQDRFMAAYDALSAQTLDVRVLRLGAVFYAQAGAQQAMSETSFIGTASLVGSVALILVVFRAASPLMLSVLAMAAGMAFATSVSLLLFGRLHAAAMMFGASLIGVAVDYSLHYFAQVFTGHTDPHDRLHHVMPGLVLGLATTLIGYGALALSPLPGLQQVAVFSAAGLLGSFATVLLWFPLLDRSRPRPLSAPLRSFALALWRLWDDAGLVWLRRGLIAAVLTAAAWGATRLEADDDVRRQQALNPALVAEQAELQRLIGIGATSQFFLVNAADTQAALVQEEALAEKLVPLKADGVLSGWRSPARFVPSAQRQQANARLVAERLEQPHGETFRATLGMSAPPARTETLPLALADLLAVQALPLLPSLVLGEGLHMVALDNPTDMARLRHAAEGLDGVRFIDPTADLTRLLGVYRLRALWLLAASAVLMVPLLAWRYGLRGSFYTLVPPVAALVLTPLLLATLGMPFSFFGAMALVLVLSIGVDYGVFCAEADGARDPITVLATWLATLTTLLSFGLLAFSQVAAVRSFGSVMLVGITLAVLLAPIAGRARPRRVYLPWQRPEKSCIKAAP